VKPDIVVARSLIGYGMLARYSRFKPYVLIGTGPDVNNLPNGSFLRKTLAREIITNADYVWLYGDQLRKIVNNLFPSTRSRLFSQTHGIDINKFSYKNSCEKKVSTILCTRGFMPVYNQVTLIKAFSILIGRYPDVKLVLVGEGRTQKRCKELAENLNLDGKIEWLGYVSQEEIVEIMKEAQIFVSVSLSDGIPTSLLEAMAMGLFPIVSSIPANRQWIQEGVNGYLVPPTDEKALADALAKAIESPSFRQKSSEINLSLIKEKADLNKNMETIEKLLVSVVEKRNQ
jgi:glycosyltransferase involved in cell wall biosynthesis